MEPSGAEQGVVEVRPAHARAVHTHQPRSRLVVAQHPHTRPLVRGVAQPPRSTGFAGVRLVLALEGQPFVSAPARLDRPRRHVQQRRGWYEEPLRLLAPPGLHVRVEGRDRLLLDLVTASPAPAGRNIRNPARTISSRKAWPANAIVGRTTGIPPSRRGLRYLRHERA